MNPKLLQQMTTQGDVIIVSVCLFAGVLLFHGSPCESSELSQINPAKYKVTASPIIDIHTHNFNAHDIPLENIVLGRRDLDPRIEHLSDGEATLIAKIILGFTKTDAKKGFAQGLNTFTPERVALKLVEDGAAPTVEDIRKSSHFSAIEKAIEFGEAETETGQMRTRYMLSMESLRMQDRLLTKVFSTRFSIEELKTLRYLEAVFGSIHKGLSSLKGTCAFIANLRSFDTDLLTRYHDQNGTAVQFRVGHMMDMAPTYGQQEGSDDLSSIEAQIPAMDVLQKKDSGHLTYFVAYNPFRDNRGNGTALRIVQDAITKHHAYGVKVYPPAGYRPASNCIPGPPSIFLWKQQLQQWNARYIKPNGDHVSNPELDTRLLDLLKWCAANQIPVFAHCMDSEFQALKGYGGLMADPRYWRELLEQHSDLRALRLCLAHSGGGTFWFGTSTEPCWGADVHYLCTHYPNVYCEMGDLDEICDDQNQARFAARLSELFSANSTPDNPYSFSKKLMYGSDWYMPISQDRRTFLNRYQQVFLSDKLQGYYKSFFFMNALEYLDAQQRVNSDHFPIDPMVRSMLKKLLIQAGQ